MSFISRLKKYFFFLLLLGVFLPMVKDVKADATNNIRGWAYSVKYGYISMNCLDDDFAGRFPFTFSFMFNLTPCSFSSHGVSLSEENTFSGQAWNPVLGYITFSDNATPPDNRAFAANCENPASCTAANNCIACYNENTEKVYGYMRREVGGQWIKLSSDPSSGAVGISNYTTANPGYFKGFAYYEAASSTISFSCNDINSCATNPYQVKIGPLEIRQQTAPNWNFLQACSGGARRAVLGWNIRSGIQSAYQLIISTQNSTSSGVVLSTPKITSVTKLYDVPEAALNFNTPYYWFLKLWDEKDVETPWRQFNVTSPSKDLLTDNISANTTLGNAKTFTTYWHSFPKASFTYTPAEPLVATSTFFTSNSSYYNPLDAGGIQACGSNCTYTWQTTDDRAVISNSNMSTTTMIFARPTSTSVTLTVGDGLYNCSTSTLLNVKYELPVWKEIKAQ